MTVEELKDFYRNNIVSSNYKVTDGLVKFEQDENFISVDKLFDDYEIKESNIDEIFTVLNKDSGRVQEVIIVLIDGTTIQHEIIYL